jgi:hypothetical protein
MFTADNIVLYAALAVGVLLVVEGVYQLAVDVSAGPRAQINRRLRMLAEDPSDPRAVLRSLLRDTGGSRLARFVPTLGQLERLLVQAGVSIRVGRLLGLVGGVASPPSSSCGCSRPRHSARRRPPPLRSPSCRPPCSSSCAAAGGRGASRSNCPTRSTCWSEACASATRSARR